eukprot:TRINITY_DN7696_c0_g2_i2.p2 TRINITY_DN7696_c0_g2~~TRINITY_DN7696_c0_g2_i2.p2  ORF type:complete len:122 (+),score=20.18 TRINITY_DN7696_c0_g2_i2:236-601(+)
MSIKFSSIKEVLKVPLEVCCPCEAKKDANKVVRRWLHDKCKKTTYITEDADLTCDGEDCNPYFIQDASFKCTVGHTEYLKFTTQSDFLWAMVNAVKSGEKSAVPLNFMKRMSNALTTRWKD